MAIFTLADFVFGASTIRQITAVDHKTNQTHRKSMTSGGNVISQISGKDAGEVTSITSGDLAGPLAPNTGESMSAGASVTAGTNTVA